jgi:hypothetical protein
MNEKTMLWVRRGIHLAIVLTAVYLVFGVISGNTGMARATIGDRVVRISGPYTHENLAVYLVHSPVQGQSAVPSCCESCCSAVPVAACSSCCADPAAKISAVRAQKALGHVIDLHSDTVGVVVAVNGRIAGLKVFANRSALEKQYPQLLETAAAQALQRKNARSVVLSPREVAQRLPGSTVAAE